MLKGMFKPFGILLLAEALLLLALLPGCFLRERLVYEVEGAGIAETVTPIEGGIEGQGAPMELRPGVYQIRVDCHPGENQSLYVDILCEDGGFKAIKGNGVSIFSNQNGIDFEIYVTQKIKNAYVQCNIYGGGVELLDLVRVYRTSMGSRMALFMAIVCFAAIDGLLLWRRRILEGKVSREQQLAFWSVVGVVLLSYFPYLTDYFYGGADTFFHVTRIEALKESILNGCPLPVRVQDYWLFGHGYAVSLFYGDLFLIIPAVLRLIGFSLSFSYKVFVLLAIIATVLIGYFSMYKCVKDRSAALFGMVIYTLIPYRIFDIYSRGAMGEYVAMAFMPLVCCAVYLLFTEEVDSPGYGTYKWYLVIGMSALLQSHLISTELSAVFIAAVCVICWKKTLRRQTFRELFQATGIVVLANCWFWLPMLYMMVKDHYKVSEIVSKSIQARGAYLAGMFQVLPNKGAYQEGMYKCEPVQLGAAALLIFAVFFGYLFWHKKKMYHAEKWFATLTLLTVVLSLRAFPWDFLQTLPGIGQIASVMQFPTRLMMLATVFFGMFAAFFYRRLRMEGTPMFSHTIPRLICAVAVFSCIYHVNDIAFVSSPIYLYTAENMGTVTLINGEYLLDGADSMDFYAHGPVAEEGLRWDSYEKRGTEMKIRLQNDTGELRFLEIPVLGYQGYAVRSLEGEGEPPYIAEKRGTHGDLRLAVPGDYHGAVRIWYRGFAIFRAAEVISGITVLVLVGYALVRRLRSGCRN